MQSSAPAPPNDVIRRIDAARTIIEQRLDEDVPMEDLAAAAHYSLFHFHRLFRGITGETVRELARRLRLERAAIRLTQSPDDILGIALDAKYESHEAFARAFKRRFGVPPSTFRDERRELKATRAAPRMETPMDIRIEHRDPARIAFVRHTGPYENVGDAWKALMKWGWSKMMFAKPDTFGLCYDDPDITPPSKLRYEACMTISEKAKEPKPASGVECRDYAGGDYAVTLHEGPYENASETYAALFARVASEQIDGRSWSLADPPSIEIYLNDPRKTRPDDLRTEIWAPITRSS